MNIEEVTTERMNEKLVINKPLSDFFIIDFENRFA